ncbi:MAG TPA: YHYH protein [Flavobacteriales bacterium]|nr:YHYH protein [Flavobacteriales bacterium]
MESVFAPFKPIVKSYWKGDYFFIESNGLPQHRMMVGITAWNQQVPLPHPFTGDNAFRLPLFPKISANPVSGRENLFKGAIAVAVNGIPIFNPIKQDGRTDTNLAGELDEYGGHAGRADDYHYHIAPVHLQKIIGEGKPIAFALDGYPIYGYKEPDGSSVKDLDWLNGHTDKNGNYHYHATSNYPYLNGGFRGQVDLAGGQVAVQPKTRGVRPYTRPLRGAKITGFEGSLDKGYSLNYNHNGVDHVIRYLVKDDGQKGINQGDLLAS